MLWVVEIAKQVEEEEEEKGKKEQLSTLIKEENL